VASPGQNRTGGSHPLACWPLLVMHPRIPLAFLAARAHCQFTANPLSTRTCRSFSAELPSGRPAPTLYRWLFLPSCSILPRAAPAQGGTLHQRPTLIVPSLVPEQLISLTNHNPCFAERKFTHHRSSCFTACNYLLVSQAVSSGEKL